MKTKYRILTLYAGIFIAWIIFGSNASNPPNAHTNAPFDQFCSQCHGGGQFNGTMEISGIPATVNAGETYQASFTITATQGSPVRAGFQLVSVFDSNNNNAGGLIAGSGTGINNTGGRDYIEQRGARNFSGNQVSWNFDWVAPTGPDGATIVMYYAGNLTNGNGSTSGDRPISGSTSFILSAGAAPLVAGISNQNDVSCNGENDGSATADATGGTAPYEYEWSTGATTATASGLSAGTYGVTITDADMATASTSVEISEPALLQASVSGTPVECNGDNSGSATVSAEGGVTPYRYRWSTGRTTRTINDIPDGTYTVTVTDFNNCTTTASVQITEPDALFIDISGTDETGPMANDGTASVIAGGGTGPYDYSWSNGATTSNINGLSAGTYIVTVTDANQCEEIGMITIQGMECNLQASISKTMVTCPGLSDGSATVEVTGVQNPAYIWSDGQTTATASDLAAGMYEVTISESNGCQTILATMITEPEMISISEDLIQPSCVTNMDGQIMVSISGGTAPYSIIWSDSTTAENLNNVSAGAYFLEITDANGCTTSDSFQLEANDTLAPILVSQPGTIYLDSSGLATIPLEVPFVGGTDQCGIDSIWSTPALFNCDQLGDLEVTYFATDGSGNLAQEVATVTLVDTMRPIFMTCVEDIEADSGTTIIYDTPVAFDNCGIDSFALTEGFPSGSIFPPGETKVSYMAVDASGNYECCSFFVRIGGTVATIDEEFSRGITIYPNPVVNELKIEFKTSNIQKPMVEIINANGQHILKKDLDTNEASDWSINMNFLRPGLYIAKIVSGDRVAIRKIIKN